MLDDGRLSLFPNPAQHEVSISIENGYSGEFSLTMTDLAVVYADGKKDEIETNRTKIAADQAFGPVDLKQDNSIKEIEATWRSRAIATSKRDRAYATVQVWGHH